VNLRPEKEGDYWQFIAWDTQRKYDCFATGNGGCVDAVVKERGGSLADGAYQSTLSNMALDLSVLATRMCDEESRSDGRPKFVSHLYYAADKNKLAELHTGWNEDLGKATLRTALELHWIHTIVFTLDRVGMRGVAWEKRTRFGQDELEFAVALHALRFSLFSGSLGQSLIDRCTANLNPVDECGLEQDSFLSDVRRVCKALDESSEVYDYPITWAHVQSFLATIQWSYPLKAIAGVREEIDWQQLQADTSAAFEFLASHRKSVDPKTYNGSTISSRFDARALVGVVRSRLPSREPLVGPTTHGIDHYFYGIFSDDLYADVTSWPLSSCFVAGGTENLCEQAKKPSTASLPSVVLAVAMLPMILFVLG
jgi:hypothetical protein